MSTSPDAPKGANFMGQARSARRPLWDSSRPGLILLQGLLWLAVAISVLVALGMNYELVWSVLTGTVFPVLETVFDTAERLLDSFFLLVGLGGFAPLATAYTGFVILLAVAYVLARKLMKAYQSFEAKKQAVTALYLNAWDTWYGSLRATAQQRLVAWWNSLDLLNKVVAGTFIVLIGIPVALLISFILGSLVASFL